MLSKLKLHKDTYLLACTFQVVVITIAYIVDQNSQQLIESTDWIIHTEKNILDKRIAELEKTIALRRNIGFEKTES